MLLKKILSKLFTKFISLLPNTTIQSGVFIDYRCEIEGKNNIFIGKNSKLYKNSTIYKKDEGKFVMGEDSHIAPFGYMLIDSENLSIGSNVAIAKNCSFFCVTNAISEDKNILFKDNYKRGSITIGDNVFIGTNCVILPDSFIENNVVVGANSTVKGRLESGYIYGGNPVKKVKRIRG